MFVKLVDSNVGGGVDENLIIVYFGKMVDDGGWGDCFFGIWWFLD